MTTFETLSLPTRQNLRRLCNMRLAAVAVAVLTVWSMSEKFELDISVPLLASILAVVIFVTAATLIRLTRRWIVTDLEFFGHLVFDVTLLTVFLYFTHGPTNPLVMAYLVPLALTVASLPQRYTWIMAALTTSCYGGLIVHQSTIELATHQHDKAFSLHIIGMWFGFVLSAAVIAWFGVRMTQAVRERDAQLAQLRENRLRHEQVIALGSLAAGAAHELGTPLGTLNILTDELEPGTALDEKTCEVLRSQVLRCKNILNSIAASSGTIRAQGGGQQALDTFLRSIVTKWQASRPDSVLVKSEFTGTEPVPQVITEQTLAQAITNLLNNAADASLEHVEIICHWTEAELTIEVADRGEGLAPEVAQRAGEAFTTTKTHGLGLGLFLTFATLERLGGEVHLYNREGGGTICRLKLPLSSLSVTP